MAVSAVIKSTDSSGWRRTCSRHYPRAVDAVVAIIAGLVGGSLGALITTLMTISHEREKQLRERKITAADIQLLSGVGTRSDKAARHA